MAIVLLTLRGNVALPGDRALSDRELQALLPGNALVRRPMREAWRALAGSAAREGRSGFGGAEDALLALLTASADEAYVGRLAVREIAMLLARATFLQQVFATPLAECAAESLELAALAHSRTRFSRWEGTKF